MSAMIGKKVVYCLIIAVLAPVFADGARAEGLKARVVLPLNQGWKFKRQATGGGALGSYDRDSRTGAEVEPEFAGATGPDCDDRLWSTVDIPHTWNAHDVFDAEPGYFRGIGWYRRRFVMPPGSQDYRVKIAFEAVNQKAVVWVNGREAGRHAGGYTGFELDITDLVRPAPEENVLTVRADNIYDPDVAPTVKSDINFYGGIYRDVYLILHRPVHIEDLFIQTQETSAKSAKIIFQSRLVNLTGEQARLQLIHRLFNRAGEQIETVVDEMKVNPGDSLTVTRDHKLNRPELWSPSNPYPNEA